jgi:hypothetical protein
MAKVVFLGPGSSYETADGKVVRVGGELTVDKEKADFLTGHHALRFRSVEDIERQEEAAKELAEAHADAAVVTEEPPGPVALMIQERQAVMGTATPAKSNAAKAAK